MQNDSGLFEIRLTDPGKKFIRKFVTISYTIMVLVLFESAVSIYWSVKMAIAQFGTTGVGDMRFVPRTYDLVYPFLSILFSLLAIISNFYYVRFPRVLLCNIEMNNEPGANAAFSLLFKGAFVFLIWLLLSTANMLWSLVIR